MIKNKKTWVEISRNALLHNIRSIKAHVKPVAVMAVVKANAYGHDAIIVAKTVAKDADWFGVDDIDEAITLRKAGIKKPVLILGYTPLTLLADCAKYDI